MLSSQCGLSLICLLSVHFSLTKLYGVPRNGTLPDPRANIIIVSVNDGDDDDDDDDNDDDHDNNDAGNNNNKQQQ